MRMPRADPGYDRIATFDIETTDVDPGRGEIVSIGVGVHDRGSPGTEATYETLHRDGSGEVETVRRAMARLEAFDADGLVSFNGVGFDREFIEGRLERHGAASPLPGLVTSAERHLDLFADRKREAGRRGHRWPSLERCLDAYGYPRPETVWRGRELTNTRFGRELGPAYLGALERDASRAAELAAVIDHYLVTDLEANVAVYHADIGEDYDPAHLGSRAVFE